MTRLSLSLRLLLCIGSFFGIELNGQIPSATVSLGYGKMILPQSAKAGNFATGSHHVEFGAFFPLRTYSNRRQLGIDFKIGETRWMEGDQLPTRFSNVKYDDGSGTPVPLSIDHMTGRTGARYCLAGPSWIFNNSRFFVSPSLLAGLGTVWIRYNRYYDTLQNTNPGEMKVIDFYSFNGSKRVHLVINPSIKAGIRLSDKTLVSVTGQYFFGPRYSVTTYSYFLNPPSASNGVYTYQEITNGGPIVGDGFSRWRGFVIQLNLSYKLSFVDKSNEVK